MRVQLSSVVTLGNVDLSAVNETYYLDVVGCAHVLQTLEGTLGNETSTLSRLAAPRYFLMLSVTNGRVRVGWGPKAEVYT